MIQHRIQCEMCEQHFQFSPMQRPTDRVMPPGWFIVFPGEMNGSEGWHFCSKVCLNRWTGLASHEEEKPT